MYQLTNGQPFLLQRLCWELVTEWNEHLRAGKLLATERTMRLAGLEAHLNDGFFKAANYYFDGVWKQSEPTGQSVLAVLAQVGEEGITLSELSQKLPQVQIADLKKAIVKLGHRDVVSFDSITGKIQFLAELNRRWVIRKQADLS